MTITFYAEDEVVGTTEFQLPPPHGVEVPLAASSALAYVFSNSGLERIFF